jgi:hypothetical protein
MGEKMLTNGQQIVLAYFLRNESNVLEELEKRNTREDHAESDFEDISKKYRARVEELMKKYTKEDPIVYDFEDGSKHFMSYPGRIEKYTNKRISKSGAIKVCKKLEEIDLLSSKRLKSPGNGGWTTHYYIKTDYNTFKRIIGMLTELSDETYVFMALNSYYCRRFINASLVKKVLSEKNVEIKKLFRLWDFSPNDAQILYDNYYSNSQKALDPVYENNLKKMVEREITGEFSVDFWEPTFAFTLPIFESNYDTTEIRIINKSFFEKYSKHRSILSAIEEHYNIWVNENVILPILYLISTSSKALNWFLNGDWKPTESHCHSTSGETSLRYMMFNLLLSTMEDIIRIRHPLNGYDVELRPKHNSPYSEKRDYLFSISSGLRTIYYDASFSTLNQFYPCGEDVIYTPNEHYYKFESSVYNGCYFRKENVRDFQLFVGQFTDENNVKARFIFDHLSNRLQNMLIYCKQTNYVPEKVVTRLIEDINRLIIQFNFYQDAVNLLKQQHELSEANEREYISLIKVSVLQESHFEVAYANMSILKNIFPDLIDTGYIMAPTEENES